MSYWGGRLAVFDVETTGVDVDTSRIVTACVAVLESDGSIAARWDWFADPGVDIPEAATAVHGIGSADAQRLGRPAPEVVGEVTQTLRTLFALGVPVAIFNAPFDLSLLDRECRRHHVTPIAEPGPVVDPLVLDRVVDPDRATKRTLTLTCAQYGVDLDGAHDSGRDAVAAGRVAQEMARRFADLLDIPSDELHRRQQEWYADQAAEYQEHVRAKGDDEYVANALWPVRPAEDYRLFEDTQPIPAPPLRPSATVPTFDLTGSIPLAIEATIWQLDAPAAGQPDVDPAPEAELDPELEPEDGFESEPAAEPEPDVAPESEAELEAELEPEAELAPEAEPTVMPARREHVAAAIITDPEGRNLVVRRQGGAYFLPAGGAIARGESAIAALIRLLDADLGLEVDVASTEFLGSFEAPSESGSGATVRAEVFALAARTEVAARSDVAELRWLEPDAEVDGDLAPLTRDVLVPLWTARRT